MKKIVKKHYRFIIGLVIGIIISTTVTYGAENILTGSDVSYNTGTSHGSKNNIQGAIDELYEKADSCTPKDPIESNKCKVVTGTGKTLGDEIKCGSESFYVIENTTDKMVLFAKYNLEVGYNCVDDGSIYCETYKAIESPSGLQSSSCDRMNCQVYDYIASPSHISNDSKGDGKYKEALEKYEDYLRNTLKIKTATVSMVDTKFLSDVDSFSISCSDYASLSGSSNKPWIYNQGYQVLANSNNNSCSVSWAPVPFSLTTGGKMYYGTQYSQNPSESYYGGLRAVVEITK